MLAYDTKLEDIFNGGILTWIPLQPGQGQHDAAASMHYDFSFFMNDDNQKSNKYIHKPTEGLQIIH